MLLHLGTSWSTVSLSSIQTRESLHTKSISNLGSSTATGENGEFRHLKRSSRLTLCPLMPGSPAVPGIPRTPCRERTTDQESGLLRFQVVFSLTEEAEEQSLTEVPASPRSPGRPDLPGSPYFRQTKTNHIRPTTNKHHTGKTKRFYKNPFIQSLFCLFIEEVIREFLTSSPFFPGGPAGPRGPMGP